MKEYPAVRDKKRCPTHPGVVLRDDVLPALGLSVSEAARLLGVSRQALHRVLGGHAAVSAAMAVRLGKLCGNGPGLWVRMQAAYDTWQAEQVVDTRRIPTLHPAA
jgi:addiction module HigA family antidote